LAVDFMPTDSKILGFSNKWYKDGIRNRVEFTLPSGTKIYALSLSYFLATKLEAYFSPGVNDPRISQDLEDIANVIDGIPETGQVSKEAAFSELEATTLLNSTLSVLRLKLLGTDPLDGRDFRTRDCVPSFDSPRFMVDR